MKNVKKGFTIVELVIVIAVISILTGVLIPTFTNILRNARQSSAYQQANAEYLLYRTTKIIEHGADEEFSKNVLIYVQSESENYFFIGSSDYANVDNNLQNDNIAYSQIINPENGTQVISINTYSTTPEIAKDVKLQTPQNTYKINSEDLSKGIDGELPNVMIYKLDNIQETFIPDIPDSPIEQDKEVGDEITFGSYPQSDVTKDLGLTLEKYVGIKNESGEYVTDTNGRAKFLPVEGEERHEIKNNEVLHSYTWESYKYYDNGQPSDYAWYVDVAYGQERYRGVYFVKYRPCYTDYAASAESDGNHEYQDDNGYFVSNGKNEINIYWFKYEPIKWTITDREEIKVDGAFDHYNYTLRCKSILDAQHFQSKYEVVVENDKSVFTSIYISELEGTKAEVPLTLVKGLKNVLANNWQYSEAKQWLGVKSENGWTGTFADTAFNDRDLTYVQNTSLIHNGGWNYYKGEFGWWESSGFYDSGHVFNSQEVLIGTFHREWGAYFGNLNGYGCYEDLVYNANVGDKIGWTYHDPIYNRQIQSKFDTRFGDKSLPDNYFWLPSYEEFVGYKVGEEFYREKGRSTYYGNSKKASQQWLDVMKGKVSLQQDDQAIAHVTDYAVAQGAYRVKEGQYKGNGTYWLRSNSGLNTRNVNFAGYDGTLGYIDSLNEMSSDTNCHFVTAAYLGIRPCTCIKDR